MSKNHKDKVWAGATTLEQDAIVKRFSICIGKFNRAIDRELPRYLDYPTKETARWPRKAKLVALKQLLKHALHPYPRKDILAAINFALETDRIIILWTPTWAIGPARIGTLHNEIEYATRRLRDALKWQRREWV